VSNVLIRDLPDGDLDELKVAAAARNMSLQGYLLETIRAQADHIRRHAALDRTTRRFHGRPTVTDEDRKAVLDAVDAAHADRAVQLGGDPAQ